MPSRAAQSDDPLAAVMAPPLDETPDERAVRLQREDEARRISDAIDESIKQERLMQKRKKVVKLLLLGQSESGMCPPPPTQPSSIYSHSQFKLFSLCRQRTNRQIHYATT